MGRGAGARARPADSPRARRSNSLPQAHTAPLLFQPAAPHFERLADASSLSARTRPSRPSALRQIRVFGVTSSRSLIFFPQLLNFPRPHFFGRRSTLGASRREPSNFPRYWVALMPFLASVSL